MIPDATFDPLPPGQRQWRLRFSLLALLVLTTFVCLLLAWWVQPNRVVATSLFRVSTTTHTILGDDTTVFRQPEIETLKQTQIAALRSYFVLQAAMRKPGLGSLSLLQPYDDPIHWLQEHLVVEFPQGGEILSISLEGAEAHATDLARIVDAVAQAYSDEVLFKEQLQRQYDRDTLNRTLADLNSEISRKWEDLVDIVRETKQPGIIGGEWRREEDIELLSLIRKSILHWEDEAVEAKRSGESAISETLDERIAQLRKQEAQVETRIAASETPPPELMIRKRELELLQKLADEMAMKLERLEINASSPAQIQLVQKAEISPAE
jgi:hypothetical protein